MPRELINANITHVSYVDKGANRKQFFFTKSDNQPDFQKEVKLFINKEEEEQQLVYGVVYEPDVEDSHGDYMTAPEIEKAAHGFMRDARNIDKQHDFNAGVGEVVESYIAPADFTIGEETIKKGSWVLVTKASDEIWEEIKKGAITGYSMAGTAETIEKQNEKPVTKSYENDEVKGFFNLIKNFFSGKEESQKASEKDLGSIEKAGKKISAARMDKINAAFEALNELKSEVEEEEEVVKKEDIEKAVQAALEPLVKRLDSIEKNEQQLEQAQDDVSKQLEETIAKALEPLNQRLEAVEKARSVSKQTQEEPQNQEIQKHYLSGIL
ncbi:XkdF-like putative serine protease domain-containing protein [Pseudobacillus sp. 179-B 2D1 NHS]|uniref:XkdF-like putative serine protease domain-containing protein n=1 Tax=Pseudobacillus sp. 179-B 2D1 NHS TaxID=3374292 RepID=UPI00387A1F5D